MPADRQTNNRHDGNDDQKLQKSQTGDTAHNHIILSSVLIDAFARVRRVRVRANAGDGLKNLLCSIAVCSNIVDGVRTLSTVSTHVVNV